MSATIGFAWELDCHGTAVLFTKAQHKKTETVNGAVTVNARGFGDPLIDTYIVSLAPMIGTTLATSTDGTRAVTAWRCGNTNDGTNMPGKFLPGSCKG